jgi:DNA-binding beta-propeller fold protein YncE
VPRINPGRGIPEIAIVDGDTLRSPVRICEGADNTLWVAYRAPRPVLVQWDVAVVPPVRVTAGLVRDDSILSFGGIAADPDSGYVYVADAGRSRIGKYAPSAAGGSRITLLATQGNGDHFVQQPHGIFFFQDSLLVADTGKGWIQVLGADVPRSGRGQVTGPASSPLILLSPLDVWVDALGMFYVTDTGGARTLQLDPQGRIEEIVNEFDPEPAPAPNTLAATAEEVWVVDPDGGRLTIYRINTATEELP